MKVAFYQSDVASYTEEAPFHPPELYPELAARGFRETNAANRAYEVVRNTLRLLGGDPANPLGRWIRPGDRVVIKPNLVSHEHGAQLGQRCLTTHGSVIRAIVDYAFLAGGPQSTIVVADAPVQGANFKELVAQQGLDAIREFYARTFGYDLAVLDLRQVHAVLDEQSALIRRVEALPGDPRGYSIIDLGAASGLQPLDAEGPRYAVGDYDQEVTNSRHRDAHHEYVIANTVLDADVVINLPKLKTHSKVGLTMALKNMVGIVGSKDCLPHHRHGTEGHGGDEFPRDYPKKWLLVTRVSQLLQGHVPQWLWRMLRRGATTTLGAGTPSRETRVESTTRKFFPSGSWWGNDTIWRTVDDLNVILRHWSRKQEAFVDEVQRRTLTIVDGIVSMEGNGPLKGSPRATGVMLASEDSLALDVTAATLIGFDWQKMNMLAGMAERAVREQRDGFAGEVDAIEVVSNVPEIRSVEDLRARAPHLPPAGWRNHVETD